MAIPCFMEIQLLSVISTAPVPWAGTGMSYSLQAGASTKPSWGLGATWASPPSLPCLVCLFQRVRGSIPCAQLCSKIYIVAFISGTRDTTLFFLCYPDRTHRTKVILVNNWYSYKKGPIERQWEASGRGEGQVHSWGTLRKVAGSTESWEANRSQCPLGTTCQYIVFLATWFL